MKLTQAVMMKDLRGQDKKITWRLLMSPLADT